VNFLAHLLLAGDDDGLRLGAMLGDFVRGKRILARYPTDVRTGIEMHRHIDRFTDDHPSIAALRETFNKPFRRYSGIIIDVALDHELALRWSSYSTQTLEEFDLGVRELLAANQQWVPGRLEGFMKYADERGLFAAYRNEEEIIYTLQGIGRRFLRKNPLHRVDEIWPLYKPRFEACFLEFFPMLQSDVADWLNSRSTITGS
jgi:acyl carrier protein phosphodiesterase